MTLPPYQNSTTPSFTLEKRAHSRLKLVHSLSLAGNVAVLITVE